MKDILEITILLKIFVGIMNKRKAIRVHASYLIKSIDIYLFCDIIKIRKLNIVSMIQVGYR